MKNIIILTIFVAGGYYYYTNYLDPTVAPYKSYEKFSALMNNASYDEAAQLVNSGSEALQVRMDWHKMYKIHSITQSVHKVISKKVSADGNEATFVIEEKAWTVPGMTAPAFPDFSFNQNVVLVKSGGNWVIDSFNEEITVVEVKRPI